MHRRKNLVKLVSDSKDNYVTIDEITFVVSKSTHEKLLDFKNTGRKTSFVDDRIHMKFICDIDDDGDFYINIFSILDNKRNITIRIFVSDIIKEKMEVCDD